MARHDGDLRSSPRRALSLHELLDLLDAAEDESPEEARARACYLASGEGWRDAANQLGGAFAKAAVPPGGEQE